MEIIKLEKDSELINVYDIMPFDIKIVKNNKEKTYGYCARLTDYVKTDNIKREYFNETELLYINGFCFLAIGKFRLDRMLKDEIYEFKLSIYNFKHGSEVEKSYVKVISNNDLEIEFMVFDAAYKAFSSL